MIEISITQKMQDAALEKTKHLQFDKSKGLSKFGSEKNRTIVGFIGEEIVKSYLKIKSETKHYHFDLIYHQKKLEVKTISCKFKPHAHYLCTVNSYKSEGVHQQQADYYVFLRILNDYSKGWILGCCPCEEFFEKGKFVKKGDQVVRGLQFEKANATVLPIHQLYSLEILN